MQKGQNECKGSENECQADHHHKRTQEKEHDARRLSAVYPPDGYGALAVAYV